MRTYDWVYESSVIHCFKSKLDRCIISQLAEPNRRTPFHDDTLIEATKKINSILDDVKKENSKKTLRILLTNEKPLLAWVKEGAVGREDDEKTKINLGLIEE